MKSGLTYSDICSNSALRFLALLMLMMKILRLLPLFGRTLVLSPDDDFVPSPLAWLDRRLLCLRGIPGDDSEMVDLSNTESSPGTEDSVSKWLDVDTLYRWKVLFNDVWHFMQRHDSFSTFSYSSEHIEMHDLWYHNEHSSQHTAKCAQLTWISQNPHGYTVSFLGPGFSSISPLSISINIMIALRPGLIVGERNERNLYGFPRILWLSHKRRYLVPSTMLLLTPCITTRFFTHCTTTKVHGCNPQYNTCCELHDVGLVGWSQSSVG